MMDKDKIKNYLSSNFLSEADKKPIGLQKTETAQELSKKQNDKALKDVSKDMADYTKSLDSNKKENAKEVVKRELSDDEKHIHDDIELFQDTLLAIDYDNPIDEKFQDRFEKAIAGDSTMGNSSEYANVVPKQQGFTGPDFGKTLVAKVKRMGKVQQNVVGGGNTMLPLDGGKKGNYGIKNGNYGVKNESIENNKSEIKEDLTKQISTGDGWDAKAKKVSQGNLTLNSYAKKLYSLFKKEGAKVLISSTGFKTAGDLRGNQVGIDTATTNGEGIKITLNAGQNSMTMANKYGPMILKSFPDLEVGEKPKESDFGGVTGVEFTLKPKKGNNLTENKIESMKRLRFKKPFNGLDNALNLIPESYKIDNKVFEITDGNETYKIRWEGSLNEGRAIALSGFERTVVNEDIEKIKHLMNFKSEETLGTVKGNQRIDENVKFSDIWNKSKALLTESEEEELEEVELSDKQEKIAGLAGDKNKIDADDFAALRSGAKIDEENLPTQEPADAAKVEALIGKNSSLVQALSRIDKKDEVVALMSAMFEMILKGHPQLASALPAIVGALKADVKATQQAPAQTSITTEEKEMDRLDEVLDDSDDELTDEEKAEQEKKI
jgi:hypothetical protein